MKFFLVRWFAIWRKSRIIKYAWALRMSPPCKYCERPTEMGYQFCPWCGAARDERNTSGSMPLTADIIRSAKIEQPGPRISVPLQEVRYNPGQRERDKGREIMISQVLPGYHRHDDGMKHWQMKAFKRLIEDRENNGQ